MQIRHGDNLPRIKVTNQSSIRKIIYFYGPITRQEIAKTLDLTTPTVTTNINSMLASGILTETKIEDVSSSTPGRRSHQIDLAADSHHFIGIEIRGSHRRLCVTNYRGKVIYQSKDDAQLSKYEDAIASAASMIRSAFAEPAVSSLHIAGIGAGIPGLVDMERGTLDIHPGYGWINKHVADDLASLCGYSGPIVLSNNVYARALGIQLFKREQFKDMPSFSYMFISTGIACPFITNSVNTILPSVGYGEVGHMVMNTNGPICQCGNHGCLEAYSSDTAVINSCHKLMLQGGAHILADICNGTAPTIEQIVTAQEQGDEDVKKIIDEAVFYLGVAAANIINLFRPHTMFIDGVLFSNEQNRIRFMDVEGRNVYHATADNCQIDFTPMDTYSGAKGAAAVAIRNSLETYIK